MKPWKNEFSHAMDSAESQEPMPYTGQGHGSLKSDSMYTNISAGVQGSTLHSEQGYRPRVVKPYMKKQLTSTYTTNKGPQTFAIAEESYVSRSDHSTATHVPLLLPTPLLKKKSSVSSTLTTVNGQVPDFEGNYSNNMFGMKSSTSNNVTTADGRIPGVHGEYGERLGKNMLGTKSSASINVTNMDGQVHSIQENYSGKFEDRLLGTKSSTVTTVGGRVPHEEGNYGQHYMSEASVTNDRNVDRKNRRSDAGFEGSNSSSVTNEQYSVTSTHSSSVTLVKPYVRKRKFVDES